MDIACAYSRFGEPLYRFIYRFTGNRELAEEILQDTFIQLMAGKYSGDEISVKNWLYTVARNKCLNHLKRHRESVVERPIELQATPEPIESESLLRLHMAEASLPDDLKSTWSLRKDGLDYQQIADKLAIPVGTVKSRFSRLVKFMKKELADDN